MVAAECHRESDGRFRLCSRVIVRALASLTFTFLPADLQVERCPKRFSASAVVETMILMSLVVAPTCNLVTSAVLDSRRWLAQGNEVLCRAIVDARDGDVAEGLNAVLLSLFLSGASS